MKNFLSFIVKDDVFNSLSSEWEKDDITLSLMRHTIITLQQLISRVTEDYMPSGKYHNAKKSKSFRADTASTPKHNKLPERVFGYLDYLIKKRLSASAIANEAQIMFVFNKTSDFMTSLSKEEKNEMINSVIGNPQKNSEKRQNREKK